jgi:hypothetical protein
MAAGHLEHKRRRHTASTGSGSWRGTLATLMRSSPSSSVAWSWHRSAHRELPRAYASQIPLTVLPSLITVLGPLADQQSEVIRGSVLLGRLSGEWGHIGVAPGLEPSP